MLLFLLILFSSSQVTAGDQILRPGSSVTSGDQIRWRGGEDLHSDGGDTGPGLGLLSDLTGQKYL